MTTADQPPPPQNSSPWNWPAEWAVERTFWREVGTRTVAGVLTIVILAVPGVIYATVFGLLKLDQVFQILIGIALFILVLVIYVVVLLLIRRRERKKIARALDLDKSESIPTLTPEQIMGFSQEQRARLMSLYSRITQEDISQAERRSRWSSVLASVVAALASVAVSLIPLLFR